VRCSRAADKLSKLAGRVEAASCAERDSEAWAEKNEAGRQSAGSGIDRGSILLTHKVHCDSNLSYSCCVVLYCVILSRAGAQECCKEATVRSRTAGRLACLLACLDRGGMGAAITVTR
jgi:hypothetical protein